MERCARCGALGETKQVTILRSIGLLIAINYKAVSGRWCRPCIDAELGPATLVTATLGWWSIIGLFLTPIFLAGNLGTFLRTRGMQLPSAPGALGAPVAASSPLPASASSSSGPAGNGGAIAVGLLGAGAAGLGLLLVAFFGYLWAFGTSPDDARFSPVCLTGSFLACVVPGLAGAAYGVHRVMKQRGA